MAKKSLWMKVKALEEGRRADEDAPELIQKIDEILKGAGQIVYEENKEKWLKNLVRDGGPEAFLEEEQGSWMLKVTGYKNRIRLPDWELVTKVTRKGKMDVYFEREEHDSSIIKVVVTYQYLNVTYIWEKEADSIYDHDENITPQAEAWKDFRISVPEHIRGNRFNLAVKEKFLQFRLRTIEREAEKRLREISHMFGKYLKEDSLQNVVDRVKVHEVLDS